MDIASNEAAAGQYAQGVASAAAVFADPLPDGRPGADNAAFMADNASSYSSVGGSGARFQSCMAQFSGRLSEAAAAIAEADAALAGS